MVKPMISFRETKIRNVEFPGTTPWAFIYSACTTQPLGCLHGSTSCLTANCKQAAALSHVRTTRVLREKQLKGIARWSDLSLRVFLVQISSQSLHSLAPFQIPLVQWTQNTSKFQLRHRKRREKDGKTSD